MFLLPLAQFGFNGGDMIGLASVVVIFSIPIVAILTKHQQKMAELYRDQNRPLQNHMPQANTEELAAIRQLLTQQTIAMDNLATSQRELARALASRNELADRLEIRG